MIKYILLLVIFTVPSQIYSQTSEKNIEGLWVTNKEDMKIRIYKEKETYSGKIVWLSENSKYLEMKGSYILKNLDYNPNNNKYENGVFLWKKGKAKCKAWLEESNELNIRIIKVGLRHTQVWKREKD